MIYSRGYVFKDGCSISQVSVENVKAIVIRKEVAQCVGPVPHDELSNAFRLLLFYYSKKQHLEVIF